MPYAPTSDGSLFTRRTVVFIVIVAFHGFLIWGLNSGMSKQLVNVVFGPIETRMIEEAPDVDEPPPPPPPKIETPPPFVPPPEVSIELPAENTSNTAITQTTTTRPAATPAPVVAAPPPIPRTAPKSDPKRPLTQPEYPPSSRRAGEAGTVILEVYVMENGRVGDVRVKQSSGHPRLDEAAMREVKRSWRLIPGTENGKPVAMWGQFAVTFKLTD
jgi:periplasmic protein TonB